MDIGKTLDIITEDEGFVRHVYKDSEGYWTIGHGILVDERRGGGIHLEESLYIVEKRLYNLSTHIEHYWPWVKDLSPPRQSALLQMAYNLGFNGLRSFKRMLFAMECEEYNLAAVESLDSKWAKQVGSRADRIANLIRLG